jgi:hypothetical protein
VLLREDSISANVFESVIFQTVTFHLPTASSNSPLISGRRIYTLGLVGTVRLCNHFFYFFYFFFYFYYYYFSIPMVSLRP